jgi:hypothetical protein
MGGIAAVFALSSLFAVVPPQPVEAGSCTGWESRREPPRSVRVLLTRSGKVVKVGFKTYVAKVMASGEWPSYLPKALLTAGAFAAKQYAWYYTLRGHHRDWYRTRSGACYDVRNDTNDQLFYRGAKPTKKQWNAVNRLWRTSLRRKDRFILTGYRAASTSSVCARDANGWHLFARSAADCARKDISGKGILRRYYGDHLVRFVR